MTAIGNPNDFEGRDKSAVVLEDMAKSVKSINKINLYWTFFPRLVPNTGFSWSSSLCLISFW